jgi:hypothetical protein
MRQNASVMEEPIQIEHVFTQKGGTPLAGSSEIHDGAKFRVVQTEPIFVSVSEACWECLRRFGTSTSLGRSIMHNRDFVSDGFLTLTAASLVLLGSSLLVFAFG